MLMTRTLMYMLPILTKSEDGVTHTISTTMGVKRRLLIGAMVHTVCAHERILIFGADEMPLT